jgi:DNA-directed RNA polymerase subunit RPC12/RpoP
MEFSSNFQHEGVRTASLSPRNIVRWLQKNINKLTGIRPSDADEVFDRMVGDGAADDNDRDYRAIEDIMETIGEAMRDARRDFRSIVRSLDPMSLRSSDYSHLRSRRAMYWGAPDRVYRLTRTEQENGNAICPKCKKEMNKEPFTKSDKLYTCQSCGFKVPTSKTTTTRITVDVDNEGEVDVDVTTARRGRNSSVARELVAIDFPTQDAYDKYMKEHPDADKSKHKIKPQTREQVDKYLREHPGEAERRTRETPEQVEERLKKQMGDKYKPQKERTEEAKKEWDKKTEEWRKKGRPAANS